jgi:hypothetical protein
LNSRQKTITSFPNTSVFTSETKKDHQLDSTEK